MKIDCTFLGWLDDVDPSCPARMQMGPHVFLFSQESVYFGAFV